MSVPISRSYNKECLLDPLSVPYLTYPSHRASLRIFPLHKCRRGAVFRSRCRRRRRTLRRTPLRWRSIRWRRRGRWWSPCCRWRPRSREWPRISKWRLKGGQSCFFWTRLSVMKSLILPKTTMVARIVPICVKSQVMFWPLTMTETANVLATSSRSMMSMGPLKKSKYCVGIERVCERQGLHLIAILPDHDFRFSRANSHDLID